MPGSTVAETLSTTAPATGGKSPRLVVIRSGGSTPAATSTSSSATAVDDSALSRFPVASSTTVSDEGDRRGAVGRLHAADQPPPAPALVDRARDVQEPVDDPPREAAPERRQRQRATWLSEPSTYQPAVHRIVSTMTSPHVISASASAGSRALNNHGRRAAFAAQLLQCGCVALHRRGTVAVAPRVYFCQ